MSAGAPLIALTRAVSPSLSRCELTHLDRRPINVARAEAQHAEYEAVLESLGCEVRRVEPAPELPDGVFVEDTAVVLPELALLARPGAASRRSEVDAVAVELARYRTLRTVQAPATLDGGDVLVLGRRVYAGASTRTNATAIHQLRAILEPLEYEVRTVAVRGCLHLKTAVTEVADGLVVINSDWADDLAFADYDRVRVAAGEPFAANVLRIGHTVVMASAHASTRKRLQARGVDVVSVDVSELARAEGGVTCCSLLVPRSPNHGLRVGRA